MKKLRNILTSALVVLLFISATLGIYFYSKGYRLNITQGGIEKTGLIWARSYPSNAFVFINDKYVGKTPKTFGNLDPKNYKVGIYKDGYWNWEMNLNVKEEQSVPLEAYLFLKNPKVTEIYSPEKHATTNEEQKVLDIFTDEDDQIVIFTVLVSTKSANTTLPAVPSRFEIWTYNTNKRFWEVNVAPRKIATLIPTASLQSTTESKLNQINPNLYSLSISSNTQRILLETIVPINSLSKKTTSGSSIHKYLLLNTDTTNETPTDLTDKFTNSITRPTLSEDSGYIFFSKNEELRTYNVQNGSISVIASKASTDQFIWTTLNNGQVYITQKSETGISIIQTRATGESPKTILEKKYDEKISKDTKFTDLRITPNGRILILFAEDDLFLISLDNKQVTKQQAEDPKFISFSPDSSKFLYTESNGKNLWQYTFFLQYMNHPLYKIGAQKLVSLTDTQSFNHIMWHPSSSNILVSIQTQDTSANTNKSEINVISTDTKKMFSLYSTDTAKSNFAIGSSGSYLVSLNKKGSVCTIVLYEAGPF